MAATARASLLIRLLRQIQGGALLSTQQLAQDLEISPALVEPMLESLVAQGYVQPVSQEGACSTHCRSCALRPACLQSGNTVWVLSEKGQRAVGQQDDSP